MDYKPCIDKPITIPNGESPNIEGTGSVRIHVLVGGRVENVKHVPNLKYRLFSEIAMNDQGLFVTRGFGGAIIIKPSKFGEEVELSATGTQICGKGSSFTLDTTPLDSIYVHVESANAILIDNPTSPTWTLKQAHHILGHISPAKIWKTMITTL